MTTAQAIEYLTSVVTVLTEHRPELLRHARGRWVGPDADSHVPSGVIWRGNGMIVLVSPWRPADGSLWLHVSVSRRDRDPDYADLTEVRDRFFRPGDTVLHVWPPRAEHYSHHPHCLHLWTPMDGSRPIPDLRGDGGGV